MDIENGRFRVIGGAGLICSHLVDQFWLMGCNKSASMTIFLAESAQNWNRFLKTTVVSFLPMLEILYIKKSS